MFIILSGSSGVGKNTVIKKIQETHDQFVFMPTYTTRSKREGEIEGYPFYYITKQEFQEKIKNNELIEYSYIHNNFYGSSYSIFEKCLTANKILIKDIDVEGAQNYNKLGSRTEILKIFLTASKKELKSRLKLRNEKEIKLRLKRYGYEQKQINKFDYIIFNSSLEQTSNYVVAISSINNKNYFPSKPLNKISKRKIKYYTDCLLTNKTLKPVKILINQNSAKIVKGEEKFIASIIANKPVAKLIVGSLTENLNTNNEPWLETFLT